MPKREYKMLALDVDGVMTDGGMYYTESGEEVKRFDTKDGRGIIHLQKEGVEVVVISSGFKETIIKERCKTLGIKKWYVGTQGKLEILERFCQQSGITFDEVAYIGDDINDREVIQAVGLSACPADAVGSIKGIVDVVLNKNGGCGCIREFIDEHLEYHF